MTRKRGVELHKLDHERLTILVRQIMSLQYVEGTAVDDIFITNDLAIARNPSKSGIYDRDTVMICSEGVGWEVKDEASLMAVPASSPWGYYNHTCYISPEVLWKYTTGETVDLADHIRVFGSRLENNFYLWYTTLTSSVTADAS